MRAIFGSGKLKENSGSKNHWAQRTRPISSPSGTPTAIAAPRPSNARQSVSQRGRYTLPSTNRATQRITISETGGNTNGLTQPAPVTSSHASRTSAIGTTRVSPATRRGCLVSEGMPGHQPAQPGEVEPVEQVTEHRKVDHHRQHGVVGAHAAVRENQVTEPGLRRNELRT